MPALINDACAAVSARFQKVREITLSLAASLTAEDMMIQSCPEASPTKWHLAHTTWFFETFVLREFAADYRPYHSSFAWLFNSYYNTLGPMPEKRLRASFSRPTVDTIFKYREHVDDAILTLLESSPAEEAVRQIILGIEHEQQHQELIVTDIKHALFTNPLRPSLVERAWGKARSTVAPIQWGSYTAGLVQIGAKWEPDSCTFFAFDNETPRHRVFVEPFEIATRVVTVAEYRAFMEEGGYERPEFWLSEGFAQVKAHGWRAPLYWLQEGQNGSVWSIYTLAGTIPVEETLDAPVCHVSFFEADAYARWAGHRLPTEFEWEHAVTNDIAPMSGKSQLRERRNCLEEAVLHPVATNETEGLQQAFGDVWEWTASPYTGYPGYSPLAGALGEYNGKFMSSQMVLRGGSCATPADQLRPTYRNFFSPETRWQFSGIRVAKRFSKC